jgi:hypothetical protein
MNSELNQQILKANIARLIVGELSQQKEYINLLTLSNYQLN